MVWVILYYTAAVVLTLACCAAWVLTLLTLPGNWLMLVMAALFAWIYPAQSIADRGITWTTVGVLAGLAIAGEAIEFFASAAGAARRGASRGAVVLSIVGAIVGSLGGMAIGAPVPIIGSLLMAVVGGGIGAFAGAYLGEWAIGRPAAERHASGTGAFTGRMWGTLAKLAIGAIMVAVVTYDAFV